MAVYTYDPSLFNLSMGGRGIQEFQEGSSITFEPNTDKSTIQMGVDRSVTFNKNPNVAHTLTFTLQIGSSINGFLNLYKEAVPIPFFLKDGNTQGTVAQGTAVLQALPSITGGMESTGREWKFHCVDVIHNIGGVA